MQLVQQLFGAFINRSEAYDLPNELGLVLFGSEAKVTCPMTPLFEQFRTFVEKARPDGDTSLFDALALAVEELRAFGTAHPRARRRVLCLSDGQDTSSGAQAWEVAQACRSAGITVDAVCIGAANFDTLRAIAKATGGYCFHPQTLKDALQLNELETMLSLDIRAKPPAELHDAAAHRLLLARSRAEYAAVAAAFADARAVCADDPAVLAEGDSGEGSVSVAALCHAGRAAALRCVTGRAPECLVEAETAVALAPGCVQAQQELARAEAEVGLNGKAKKTNKKVQALRRKARFADALSRTDSGGSGMAGDWPLLGRSSVHRSTFQSRVASSR